MDTDQLLDCVAAGQSEAAAALLTRHKSRLVRMIQLRLDPRLAARIDASDVVQETLAEAHVRLPEYVAQRPLPFYPWLRGIAWDKLVEMHRLHVDAEKRTVRREAPQPELTDESEMILVDRLMAAAATPSDQLIRGEMRLRLEKAINELAETDREVIVLRHLEELSFSETAAVLGITEVAVYSRYRRALERLHNLLNQG